MTSNAWNARSAATSPTWRERFRAIPRHTRTVCCLLFLFALVPAAFGLLATSFGWRDSGVLGMLGRHPGVVIVLAIVAAACAFGVAEPPRSRSVRAYARQLRGRFEEIEIEFDGALRRRSEEEARHEEGPEGIPPRR